MKNNVALLALAAGLLLQPLSPVKTAAETRAKEFPVVVFSAFTQYGLNTSIFGMYLELTNLATGEVYRSGEFWRYSRFSVIENIPQGRYVVTYCEAALPNGTFFSCCSAALTDFFGVIEIDSDSIWYLGDYKIRVLSNSNDAFFKWTGKPLSNRVLRKLYKDGYNRYRVHIFEPVETVITLKNTDFTPIIEN